jgi:hypothetical protein
MIEMNQKEKKKLNRANASKMTYVNKPITITLGTSQLAPGLFNVVLVPVLMEDRALSMSNTAHFFIFLLFLCLLRMRFLAHLSLIRDDYCLNKLLKLKPSAIYTALINSQSQSFPLSQLSQTDLLYYLQHALGVFHSKI